MENIGKIIKEERIAKGYKQKELALLLGVTQDSISLWEKGKRIPDTQYIILLCRIFNISSDYLLGLKDETGNKINISNSFNNSKINGGIKF